MLFRHYYVVQGLFDFEYSFYPLHRMFFTYFTYNAPSGGLEDNMRTTLGQVVTFHSSKYSQYIL